MDIFGCFWSPADKQASCMVMHDSAFDDVTCGEDFFVNYYLRIAPGCESRKGGSELRLIGRSELWF